MLEYYKLQGVKKTKMMSADSVFIARNVCSLPEPCVGPGNPANEVSSPEDIAFVGAQTLKITKLLE
jgi:hypothetical protein